MTTEKKNQPLGRVMIENARLAFAVLDVPEKFDDNGKPRYSATLLFPPDSPNHAACKAAMRAVAAAKWGEAKADAAIKTLTAGLKTALGDGDLKATYDGFEGMMFVGAHAQATAPPSLLDGAKRKLPRDTGVIYSGCYVNAAIEFWAQDNQFGKRINATLRGVQFAGDGESFSSSRPADEDEFDTVEGASNTATDNDFA